jgi:hypothetical protein
LEAEAETKAAAEEAEANPCRRPGQEEGIKAAGSTSSRDLEMEINVESVTVSGTRRRISEVHDTATDQSHISPLSMSYSPPPLSHVKRR